MSLVSQPDHCDQLISTGGRRVDRVWNPSIDLHQSVKDRLILDCHSSSYEKCGLISKIQEIYYVENIHKEPTHNFFMCPEEYSIMVNDIFEDNYNAPDSILGIFHTHPNNVVWPTPRDICGWPMPSLGWRYWIVTNSDVLEWRLV